MATKDERIEELENESHNRLRILLDVSNTISSMLMVLDTERPFLSDSEKIESVKSTLKALDNEIIKRWG